MLLCFDTKAAVQRALSLLLPPLLVGCGSMPLGSGNALAQSPVVSESTTEDVSARSTDTDSQLMYDLLIAELAGRRGQLDVALESYLRAAELTDDHRVSERAARLAVYGRQWPEAETMARRWRALDPASTEAPQLLGQALLRQEKTDAAVEHFQQMLNETEERRPVLRDIQVELQRNDNPSTSVLVMQALSKNFPDEVEAHLGLTRAHLINSDNAAALAASAVALDTAPQDTDALLLNAQILSATGKPEQAFNSLTAALEANAGNTELRLGYAQLLVESGRYDDVGSQLEIINDQVPEDAETLLTISLLALESRRIEQATEFFTQLKRVGGYPDQANFYLANIKDDQQEYQQAIELYDSVSQGDLQFPAQLRAAELTALLGNLDEGRERLQTLGMVASNPSVQTRLAMTESRMLQNANRQGEAIEVLSEALQRFPDDNDLLYARALAFVGTGDDQPMIDDLTRLIELDPDNAHALNALGYHYADENINLDEAEQLLVKAIALLPEDPAIMDSMGWLRYRQGKFDEAIEWLKGAYQQFPDPEIAAHLGEALWMNGARGEARQIVEQALIDNPDDERLLAVQNNIFK